MNTEHKNTKCISWYANKNELEMLNFIMKKENRNSFADTVRMLVKDRFFFLSSDIRSQINDTEANITESN